MAKKTKEESPLEDNLTKENKKKATLKKKAKQKTNKFVDGVTKYVCSKLGVTEDEIPAEWQLNIQMLEAYHYEFTLLCYEIDELDSLTQDSRYGPVANPLLQMRNRSATRLESLLKSTGLTLKSGMQLGTVEKKKEETVLEKYMKKKMNAEQ